MTDREERRMAETQKWGEPQRVVAEAELLLCGEKCRVVRDDHGDYATDYVSRDEEYGRRIYRRSLDAALQRFVEVVEDAEAAREPLPEEGVGMTTETMYREVGIKPASGGGGEWEAGEVGDDLIEDVWYLREAIEDEGGEVYELGVDEIPGELDRYSQGNPDIRGLIHDEPCRVFLVVRRIDGETHLTYVGLEPAEAERA